MDISACAYMSDDAMAQLSEATAPPMKTIKVGTGDSEYTLGGETVLYRHEKNICKQNPLCGISCSCMSDEEIDAKLEEDKKLITTVSVSVYVRRDAVCKLCRKWRRQIRISCNESSSNRKSSGTWL